MEIQNYIDKIIKCEILLEYYDTLLEDNNIKSKRDFIDKKKRELLDCFQFELLIGGFQLNVIILGYLVKEKNKCYKNIFNTYNYLIELTWENINDIISQITLETFDNALSYVEHLIIETENEEIKKEFEKVYSAVSNSLSNDSRPPVF